MVSEETDAHDAERIRHLMTMWYATRAWAEAMLIGFLGLQAASDVLRHQHRGRSRLGETAWLYRTHGVGVELSKDDDTDGIDFDFDRPDPDVWRLRLFAEKQLSAGHLGASEYGPLVADEARFARVAEGVLSVAGR
jgi:hypothetical protein